MSQPPRPPFPGLELTAETVAEISRIRREEVMSERRWRRLRCLEMLNAGETLQATAKALGTYPREVRRVGWRYIEGGLEHALSENHRYTPPILLDDRQKAKIVALACTDPPKGHARWTVTLLAEEAGRRCIVKQVSRETIRKVLAEHKLKPWREKNVVRSGAQRGVHRTDGRYSRPSGEAT